MIHFCSLGGLCCRFLGTAPWVLVLVACDQPLVGSVVVTFEQRSTVAALANAIPQSATSGGDANGSFGFCGMGGLW